MANNDLYYSNLQSVYTRASIQQLNTSIVHSRALMKHFTELFIFPNIQNPNYIPSYIFVSYIQPGLISNAEQIMTQQFKHLILFLSLQQSFCSQCFAGITGLNTPPSNKSCHVPPSDLGRGVFVWNVYLCSQGRKGRDRVKENKTDGEMKNW